MSKIHIPESPAEEFAEHVVYRARGYEHGEDLELDKIRASHNLSKVIKGLDKNLRRVLKK